LEQPAALDQNFGEAENAEQGISQTHVSNSFVALNEDNLNSFIEEDKSTPVVCVELKQYFASSSVANQSVNLPPYSHNKRKSHNPPIHQSKPLTKDTTSTASQKSPTSKFTPISGKSWASDADCSDSSESNSSSSENLQLDLDKNQTVHKSDKYLQQPQISQKSTVLTDKQIRKEKKRQQGIRTSMMSKGMTSEAVDEYFLIEMRQDDEKLMLKQAGKKVI
jgi:hypothetical protein